MDPDFDSEEEYGQEQSESSSEKGSEDSESNNEEVAEVKDNYQLDNYLIRREATLMIIALKFTRRVIVFFNEKKQCARAHALFSVFGLKAVQVNGNMK